MPVSIRPAEIPDIDTMVALLVEDATQRQALGHTLWKLEGDPASKLSAGLNSAMENENPPFRQQWLLAEDDGVVVGMVHSILLPVPPIYAGEDGAPGLIMEDCFVRADASDGTRAALFEAAEADLIAAGAKVLVASSVTGGDWAEEYRAQGYEPLTLYLSKVGLAQSADLGDIRSADAEDLPAIVAASAVNRQVLFDLNVFWKPHADADVRFGNWMNVSLTLQDRDMFVAEGAYGISQPVTPLHLPAAHPVAGVGIIDDYYHPDFADPNALSDEGRGAAALLTAAEQALQTRGNEAALIVCPAAWTSKVNVLAACGYETAITWYIKT